MRKTNILDTYSFLLLIKVTIFIITNHNIYHAFNQGSKYIKAAHGICVANGYGTTAGRIAYDWYAEFKKWKIYLDDKPRSGRPVQFDEELLNQIIPKKLGKRQKNCQRKLNSPTLL